MKSRSISPGISQDPENLATVAYDVELMRPGCAIVQRVFGGSISNEDLHRMDGWLTSPTPGMKLYTLRDKDELERLIALTNGKEKE